MNISAHRRLAFVGVKATPRDDRNATFPIDHPHVWDVSPLPVRSVKFAPCEPVSLPASWNVPGTRALVAIASVVSRGWQSAVDPLPVGSAPALHWSGSKFRTDCPKSESGKFTGKSEVSALAMIARI